MRIVIAPGASGTAATMRPYADGLVARGFEAATIDIPKRKAEEAVPAYLAASGSGPDVVIGGQSYGGRVASLLVAEGSVPFGGLVLFSYPLPSPGTSRVGAAFGALAARSRARRCSSRARPTRSRRSTCCAAPSQSVFLRPSW